MQALERVGFEGHAVALRSSCGSREHVQEVESLCAEPPARLVCERKKSRCCFHYHYFFIFLIVRSSSPRTSLYAAPKALYKRATGPQNKPEGFPPWVE